MKKRLLAPIRAFVALLFMFVSTAMLPVSSVYAAQPVDVCPDKPGIQTEVSDCAPVVETPVSTNANLNWEGNGDEDPGCEAGQTAHFHWVLTPGGNANITSGTLTVNYNTGSPDIATGTAGNGAMQFTTDQDAPAHVTSASVAYTYTGTANNPVLTISDSSCVGSPTDVCTNLAGNQAVLPEGLILGNNDDCVTPPTDVCKNIDGVQETVPQGMILDENDDCCLPPPPPTDVCKNIDGVQETVPEGMEVTKNGKCEKTEKVTICHRTDSVTNPYRRIEVSVSAVDGEGNNDHSHHTGPVATSESVAQALKDQHQKWGDIIPNVLNWSSEGQAVYGNDCKYVPPTPPTDVCPNIEGTQTSVPAGMIQDVNQNCVTPTPGRGGGQPPAPETVVQLISAPQLVGGQGAGTPPSAEQLVNTGTSALLNFFAGLAILGLTGAVTILSRRSKRVSDTGTVSLPTTSQIA